MRKARLKLNEIGWIYTPKEEREKCFAFHSSIYDGFKLQRNVFMISENGGFRILGDIIL